MNVGDLVQVAQHPDKWFRVETTNDAGEITKLEDVTTAVELELRRARSQISRSDRAIERARLRLNA